MNLLPPPSDLSSPSDTLFISLIQGHTLREGCAVITKRSNKDKREEKHKIWLCCTRSGQIRKTIVQKRKHGTSRTNDCPFECIIKLDKKDDIWHMRIKDALHNHDPGKRVAHSIHQAAALTSQVEETIIAQSANRVTPADIMYGLNHGLKDDPIWKTRDIYNAKFKFRQKMLGYLTPTQVLLKRLHSSDEWYV